MWAFVSQASFQVHLEGGLGKSQVHVGLPSSIGREAGLYLFNSTKVELKSA